MQSRCAVSEGSLIARRCISVECVWFLLQEVSVRTEAGSKGRTLNITLHLYATEAYSDLGESVDNESKIKLQFEIHGNVT